MSLFDEKPSYQPLAAQMRPQKLEEVIGQDHLLGVGKPLRNAIDSGHLHSMILWGPPGTGKTTLAHLISRLCDAHFQSLSAVLAGVKDIREAVALARQQQATSGRRTILFVDEVHRFNKSQQDAFLPHVEDGTIIFIGATTENPSFELNNALLSRARVYKLSSLTADDVMTVLKRACEQLAMRHEDSQLALLANYADGDARRSLNMLEVLSDLCGEGPLTDDAIREVMGSDFRRFDKGGDIFYEQISALHKAVRGSSPDAALYWYARMIDGGVDPFYVARRVVRMATEDIGNADPRGLQLALNAWEVQERMGSPEGELAIAQAIVYLSAAAKSNAVYSAFGEAMWDAAANASLEVPMHIRNAPTQMMKSQGYGDDYKYAHGFDDAFVAGESYFPEPLKDRVYYEPVDRGLEKQIRERLIYFAKLNAASEFQRYPGDDEDD